jgi:hypothetical protein
MEGLMLALVADVAAALAAVAVVVVVGVMLLLLQGPTVAAGDDDECAVGDFDDAVVATVGCSTVAITEAVDGLLEQLLVNP